MILSGEALIEFRSFELSWFWRCVSPSIDISLLPE